MAGQDFGLSFTVEFPALWLDNETGKAGPSNVIYADLSSVTKAGSANTIFADLPARIKAGPAIEFAASGICYPPNILSGPGISTGDGIPYSIATICS